jgi:hypothetical protein
MCIILTAGGGSSDHGCFGGAAAAQITACQSGVACLAPPSNAGVSTSYCSVSPSCTAVLECGEQKQRVVRQ